MAKELSLADIEPAIEIFKQANIQAVQKVLNRAEKKAMAAAKRQHHGAKAMMRQGKVARTLKGALGKAMDFHGRQAKGRPSIRLTAPDTGGRPYHFGYTVVTKGQRKQTTSSARRAGTEGGPADPARAAKTQAGAAAPGRKAAGTGKRRKASTREGAHQMYTERDSAVEEGLPLEDRPLGRQTMAFKDRPSEMEGAEAEGREGEGQAARRTGAKPVIEGEGAKPTREAVREASLAWAEEGMSRAPGLSEERGEAAAQRYIEDEAKVPKLRGSTASFGTIGDTIEERLRFWELVHEHESDKGGRTQGRLVLELPHEASAKERHEIVRRYTDDMFRSKGLPYWASIHAPTKGNDDRNHHAHVVFSDRPASRMVDPDTGREEWDFAVEVRKRKASRNTVVTHPYRRAKDPDMRDKGWVKRARARFAEVTNDVMVEAGKGVRYDPRSYKDMGLDASPMRNVRRIVSDKAKGQTIVVMDAEWTRRMIDQEMRDAAIRRSGTFQALVRTEALLERSGRGAAASEQAQARLPAHLRMGIGTRMGTALGRRIATAVLEGERERLARRFVEEATERTLRNVMEATRPQPKAKATGKVHDAENAPDAAALAELHQAAREEMAAHRKASATATAAAARRMQALRGMWGGVRTKAPQAGAAEGGTEEGASRKGVGPRPAAPAAGAEAAAQGRPGRPKAPDRVDADAARPSRQARQGARPADSAREAGPTGIQAPRLAPRLVPDLAPGAFIKSVGAAMGAMAAGFDVSAAVKRPSFEERLRRAGEAEKAAAEKLAKLEAKAAAAPAAKPEGPQATPGTTRTPGSGAAAAVAPGRTMADAAVEAARRNAAGAREPPAERRAAGGPAPDPEAGREAAPEAAGRMDAAVPRAAKPPAEGDRGGRKAAQTKSAARQDDLFERAADVGSRLDAPAAQNRVESRQEARPAREPEAKDAPRAEAAGEAEEVAKRKSRRKAIMSRRGRGGPGW